MDSRVDIANLNPFIGPILCDHARPRLLGCSDLSEIRQVHKMGYQSQRNRYTHVHFNRYSFCSIHSVQSILSLKVFTKTLSDPYTHNKVATANKEYYMHAHTTSILERQHKAPTICQFSKRFDERGIIAEDKFPYAAERPVSILAYSSYMTAQHPPLCCGAYGSSLRSMFPQTV